MKYARDEAVRYMGAHKGDHDAQVLADMAYLQLRNEVRAKSCWKLFECSVDAAGVTLAGGKMRFISSQLGLHLRGCGQLAVMAATLGSGADIVLRRLALTNVAQAAAVQAVCSALIESYCDEVQDEIAQAVPGLYLKPRFSPGYGDWQLKDQQKILQILNCEKKIGLTLTDGYMLMPVKSVTAVIGLSVDGAVCHTNKCRDCGNSGCEFRKE